MNEKNGVASIGVWFFSVVAAIGLTLAAVAFLQSSAGHPWLKAAIGLGAGIAFIALAELWVRARYRVPANALDAAGIGVLYATLYWMHVSGTVPLEVSFPAMLVVTAAAVWLATRHDSKLIAVLGLLGGFVTAYLLAPSGSNAIGIALFTFLLALNIGIAWITVRKGWWLLNSLAVIATAIYEWQWVMQLLDMGHLALGAAIFVVFAIAGTVPLWYGRAVACPPRHRWIAIAAAHLPLLFAIFVAANVNYGPQYNVLFAFLLIVDAGLLAIVWRGGPKWLHMAGGVATLIVFIIWFCVSYTHAAWPLLLAWAVLFIALYLVRVNVFAGVLFAPFIGLGIHEPEHWAAIVLTMFIMLGIVFCVAIKRERPIVAAIATALACVALMTLHPPLWTLIALHVILFAEIFVVAWISERHVLAILAVPFLVAVVITAYSPAAWAQYSGWTLLAIAVVPYLLFIAYPLALGARAKASIAPYVAAALASLVVFIIAWPAPKAGWITLAEAVLMGLLLWRALRLEPREPRITLMGALTLAFFNVAAAMLLPHLFVLVFALETAALSWLFTRFRHPIFPLWAAGLAAVVFFRLTFDAALYARWYVYVICGLAMFSAAYLLRNVPALQHAFSWSRSTVARTPWLRIDVPPLQPAFSVVGLFELWFLINLLIANCFHSANGALNFDFATSQPAENVWYTVAWAVIATGLLIFGYLIHWPAARGAALALLIAAVFKVFLFDLWYLQGTDLALSLLGLGASVAVVGIVLQRFTAPAPARASI